jgi:hypothetical protein
MEVEPLQVVVGWNWVEHFYLPMVVVIPLSLGLLY